MIRIVLALSGFAAFASTPATFESRKAHAQALLEERNFGAALAEAQAINRDYPDDVAAYQLLAAAHLALGNYAEAETALQWMLDLRIGKTDSRGWLLVAQFREVTGDIDGAIEAVTSAHGRLEPGQERESRALLAYAGRLYCRAGKLNLAEQASLAALDGSDSEPAALEALACVRLAQGRKADAVRILRVLAKAVPDPSCLYRLAEVTQAPADFASFERAARAAQELPGNANRELILYLAGAGRRPSEALRMARRLILSRHDVYALDALAVALFANGKSTESASVMTRALAAGTLDPEILSHAARIGVKPQ